jgi:integrase
MSANAQPVWYVDSAELKQLPFREAAEAWLTTRRGHIAPRTMLDYSYYVKTLASYFGEMRLAEISGDQVRAYQAIRSHTAGPGLINKECGVLCQMRARVGLPLADYQPLQMPKDWETVGRKLGDSERAVWERVCKAAADHHSWDAAALCSLLSMKTGLGPGEILSLKLRDVTLDDPRRVEIARRGAKRIRRERVVLCPDDAGWALEKLVRRAIDKCGADSPEHFLVPLP